jgi:hypothetical protein
LPSSAVSSGALSLSLPVSPALSVVPAASFPFPEPHAANEKAITAARVNAIILLFIKKSSCKIIRYIE